ncbi:hypothetical protein [Rathayibacter sp. AY1E8]|uniref:hypothetical protein n=2 Tax=Rathayibacter TaxID=33886 RepID=UPI0011B0AD0A|nr:hypothetical protein [Rathayibacter sp. AY1E8]
MLELLDRLIATARDDAVENDLAWPKSRLSSAENELDRAGKTLEADEQRVAKEVDDRPAGTGEESTYLTYLEKEVAFSKKKVEVNIEQVDAAEKALAEARIAAVEKHSISVRMYTSTGSVDHQGDTEMLAGKFDSRTLGDFLLKAPDYYGSSAKIHIEVTRAGLRLSVAGPEDWTTSAFAAVSEEISKSVAWWSGIRGTWGALGVVAATSVLGTAITNAIGFNNLTNIVASIVVWLVVMSSGIWGRFAIQNLVPPFEVTDGGSKPRGASAMGVLGVLSVEVVVGVLINIYVEGVGPTYRAEYAADPSWWRFRNTLHIFADPC